MSGIITSNPYGSVVHRGDISDISGLVCWTSHRGRVKWVDQTTFQELSLVLREYGRRYRASHPGLNRVKCMRWWKNNHEYATAACRDWHRRHREEIRKYRRAYHKIKYQTDSIYRLMSILRRATLRVFDGRAKELNSMALLGCSIEEAKQHIEHQFKPGMSWDNHGAGRDRWNIDHILPLDSFNLDDPEQRKSACHYTNLQPLWQSENLAKGNKVLDIHNKVS